MAKGLFVVIEGGDGCGKSTLIKNLKQRFENAVFLREPGGTEIGEKARDLIMQYGEMNKVTEMLLFASSRSELVEKVIKPNLLQGKIVICDRFVYSSYVYQGVCGGVGRQYVRFVNDLALNGLSPDVTIYLKTDKSFRAEDEAENRLDKQSEEMGKDIYQAYDEVMRFEPNVTCIDVRGKSADQVKDVAVEVILEKWKDKKNLEKLGIER